MGAGCVVVLNESDCDERASHVATDEDEQEDESKDEQEEGTSQRFGVCFESERMHEIDGWAEQKVLRIRKGKKKMENKKMAKVKLNCRIQMCK